jgi:hypothetical protein
LADSRAPLGSVPLYHLQKSAILGPEVTLDCNSISLAGDLVEFEHSIYACHENDDGILAQSRISIN